MVGVCTITDSLVSPLFLQRYPSYKTKVLYLVDSCFFLIGDKYPVYPMAKN